MTESEVSGIPVLRLEPRERADGQHLIYTHGGGYVRPPITAHWWILDRITRDTGVTVTVQLYRLAPEGDAEQAYSALRAVYVRTVAEAGAANIRLVGDSAGGALALGQAITYRDRGEPLPRQVALFSLHLDLTTLSNPPGDTGTRATRSHAERSATRGPADCGWAASNVSSPG
ncbi:alpha/beta hydrolase [Streptomyces sp. NPDC048291]|uniref:alpha/beta hydrolase n=1 Tax=Streptomyces sp. NPDC048291 TaxID=3365530 RepID=UPI0037182272